jgi:hypothetical protein
VTVPTDIHWLYSPTVFRAEIPIGKWFEAGAPDAQLVPDLVPNKKLKLAGSGPGNSIETKIGAPDGSILNGPAVRWDGLSKQLFPVQPGCHRVTWPDADGSGKTYLIEIVTAFPGDSADLTSPREDEDGKRQAPPDYLMRTPPLAVVSNDFTAAPTAHYRHLFDPVAARQPPTKLDLSAADEWAFQEMPFAEKDTAATATKTVTGAPFNASGSGRSVLLYSFRPNTDEIADGNLTKENLAVRVVRSNPVSVISRNDPKLVLGRHALELGSNSTADGVYGVIQTGGVPATGSVDPKSRFVVDFWLNAKGLQSPAAVTLSGCTTTGGATTVTCASTGAVVPGMNLSGANIPAGAKIAAITNETTLELSTAATASGSGLIRRLRQRRRLTVESR